MPPPDSPRPLIVRQPVPAHLRGLVASITAYDERGCAMPVLRQPASLVVPLIISFGAPFRIALSRSASDSDRYDSFAAGLHAGFVEMWSDGASSCIQIDFTPHGARRFFGRPLGHLADRMAPLDFDNRLGLSPLRERLGNMTSWSDRLAAVEDHVTARIAAAGPACPATLDAMRQITRSKGTIRIGDICTSLGWSRKRLSAAFHDQIGIGAKSVARIVRFENAIRLAGECGHGGWADIAFAAGLSDQPHLVREFAALAGTTPGRAPRL